MSKVQYNTVSFGKSVKIRAIGLVADTAEETSYFQGFQMVGMVMKPKFTKEVPGVACAVAVLFFNDEEIERSMADLIAWYESEGVRWGDKRPPNLAVVALNY